MTHPTPTPPDAAERIKELRERHIQLSRHDEYLFDQICQLEDEQEELREQIQKIEAELATLEAQ